MCAVAIIANGAKVNISKSLLLLDETKKINAPMKKDAIIFLKEVCNSCGLFDNVINIETTKNNAIAA